VSRRGVTLVELLVALVAGSVVATAAATLLTAQLRQAARLADRSRAAAGIHDVAHLADRELRGVAPVADSTLGVVAIDDSTLDAWMLRGTAIACGQDPTGALLVVAPDAPHPWAARWPTAPRAGDRAQWPTPADPPATPHEEWRTGDLRRAPGSARCPSTVGAPPARTFAVGGLPPAGTPIRLLRRVRWRLYRSSGGEWALGAADWTGTAWTVTQPVVAPLAPAGRTPGLRFVALDADGHPRAGPWPIGTTLSAIALEVRVSDRQRRIVDSLVRRVRLGQP
jgi:prepilin-type N-terminal cleavage/methylation domain-containing protein